MADWEGARPRSGARWEEAAGGRRSPLLPVALAVAAAAVVGWLAAGEAGHESLSVDREPAVEHEPAEEDAHEDPARDAALADDAGPWRLLPHSPLVRRSGHSITWADGELLIWGGSRPELNHSRRAHLGTGAAYDPATDRWRRINRAPISPRDEHVAAWSGEELLIWGGRASHPGPVGAAYDPAGGGWRVLPEGPLDHLAVAGDGAWTGSELLVWAPHGERLEVAAYNPARDSWRGGEALHVGPGASVDAVWAEDRLAVLVGGPEGVGTLYRYRPAGDAWDHIGGRAFPLTDGLAAANGTVVLWGHTSGEQFGQTWAVAIDIGTGALRRIPAPSVRLAREHVAVGTGARLLVWDGRRGALLDLLDDRWTTLPDAPLAPRTRPDGAWTGRQLAVWGGAGQRYHADGALLTPPPAATRAGGFASR